MLLLRTFFLLSLYAFTGLAAAANEDAVVGAEEDYHSPVVGVEEDYHSPVVGAEEDYHHAVVGAEEDYRPRRYKPYNPYKPEVVNCRQTTRCGKCNKRSGYRICRRTTLVYANARGKPCRKNFYREKCVVNCQVSRWIKGRCNRRCGRGIRWDIKRITVYPKNGGKRCPRRSQLRRSAKCFIRPCRVGCKVSKYYGNWSRCSNRHQCGYGTQRRCRKIISYPRYGGAPCPRNLCQIKRCGKPCRPYKPYKPYTVTSSQYKIAGAGIGVFVLIAGAMKFLRRGDSGSYEELAAQIEEA